MKKVLFVLHNEERCGVFQYGLMISRIAEKSTVHEFHTARCASPANFWDNYNRIKPDVVIYNYHPSVLGWMQGITAQLSGQVKQIGIIHEWVLPMLPGMHAQITTDPLVEETDVLFSPSWFVLNYDNEAPLPEIPTFGSFGFAFPGKGFERVVETVQEQYDIAHIRLHFASAFYGDNAGNMARETTDRCRALVRKPNITMEIGHDFMDTYTLLDWLAKNTINCFLYDGFPTRGVSTVPVFALSARRPVALTKSHMFRNMWEGSNPSIFVEDLSLQEIIDNGITASAHFYDVWAEEKFRKKYEEIINKVTQ